MTSAGQPDPTAPSVRVAIYPGSISISEFRELRDAIDRAAEGTATPVTGPSGKVLAVIAPPVAAGQDELIRKLTVLMLTAPPGDTAADRVAELIGLDTVDAADDIAGRLRAALGIAPASPPPAAWPNAGRA